MHGTFTYYSVSPAQIAVLKKGLGKDVDGDETGGTIEGDTPLGEVKLRYDYTESSGQLIVQVLHKSPTLPNSMIESHMREALAGAATVVAEQERHKASEPVEPIVTEPTKTDPPVPPQTPLVEPTPPVASQPKPSDPSPASKKGADAPK